MSSQNNIAKESSSLQNHIVRLCFIFVTQNTPIMHNPGFSQAIGSYFLTRFSFFNSRAIHERKTWIYHYMWNEMVVVKKTKREKIVSHQLGVSTGYGDAH